MEDASKAKASIAALNDFNLKGSRIRVEVCIHLEKGFVFNCSFTVYQVSTTQLRNSGRPS